MVINIFFGKLNIMAHISFRHGKKLKVLGTILGDLFVNETSLGTNFLDLVLGPLLTLLQDLCSLGKNVNTTTTTQKNLSLSRLFTALLYLAIIFTYLIDRSTNKPFK